MRPRGVSIHGEAFGLSDATLGANIINVFNPFQSTERRSASPTWRTMAECEGPGAFQSTDRRSASPTTAINSALVWLDTFQSTERRSASPPELPDAAARHHRVSIHGEPFGLSDEPVNGPCAPLALFQSTESRSASPTNWLRGLEL